VADDKPERIKLFCRRYSGSAKDPSNWWDRTGRLFLTYFKVNHSLNAETMRSEKFDTSWRAEEVFQKLKSV
jgi:hypothetical protein